MADNDARESFFSALNENYDALNHAFKAANDRGHRLFSALMEDAQQGQRDGIELARRWAESPLDLPAFYASLVEIATKSRGRARESFRGWLEELAEARREYAELLQRAMSANRVAAAAVPDVARGFSNRVSDTAQGEEPSPAQSNGRPSASERIPSLRASGGGPGVPTEAPR